MNFQRILVIGGDGVVGRAVVSRLRDLGCVFRWTSRRPQVNPPDRHRLNFELGRNDPYELASWQPTHALLLAGATSIRECEVAPTLTREINVNASAKLIHLLSEIGTRVAVTSSSQVFDRFQFAPMPGDPRHPVCSYGRQKAELEDIALAVGAIVVRCTKIVARGTGVIPSWISSLQRDEPVEAFDNVAVAAVTDEWAGAALLEIALGMELQQTFHLSSADEDSYFGTALRVAQLLQASPKLVRARRAPYDPRSGLIPGPHAALGHPYSSERCPLPTIAETIAGTVHREIHLSR